MGAKASTIWYVDASDPIAVLRGKPEPDPDAARALVGLLYPGMDISSLGTSALSTSAGADPATVYIGTYPGVTVICGADLAVHHPSKLPETWTRPLASEFTYLVSSAPDDAWGTFAIWVRGSLRRSFSANPVEIFEDLGLPLVWERPYWAGEFPLEYPPGMLPDPQSLPFHPQQFAEAANRQWLGFRYTGRPAEDELDPSLIEVCGFTVKPPGEGASDGGVPSPRTTRPHNRPAFLKWFRRRSG